MLLCSAIALVGCGPDKELPPPIGGVSATPTAVPSPDPTAAATTQILAAYHGYLAAHRAAGAAPDPAKLEEVKKYVGDPLLSKISDNVQLLSKNNLVVQGGPTVDPKLTELQLGATPPIATIEDCYDITTQRVVDKTTGANRNPPGQALRYRVTSKAKYFGDQLGWLIVEGQAHRDQPC